jgi:hypothetical protein
MVLLSVGTAWADVPPTALHFSGQLNTSGGSFTGTVNVTFTFYPTEGSTEVLWTETLSTTVTQGRFHALLGVDVNNLIPATAYVYDQLHLGVTVGGDAEMTPRIRVASVPFAQVARDAQTLGGLTASDLTSGTSIGSNPFFGRQASGSKSSTQAMTEITSFTPILIGNHLTPTELKLEYDCNYSYNQNSTYKAQWRYRIDYADGSQYYATPKSGWVDCPYDYTTLLEVNIPPYDPCRGSITKIALEGDGYNSSMHMYGRITVTGFETAPTGLTACKPFIGRQASGSKSSTQAMTEITSFSPISSGYNLTPTDIKFEYDCNYSYNQNSTYKAQWRYRIDFADGGYYYATPKSGWVDCPYDYTTLTHIQLTPHPNMTGRITKITLEGDGYNSSMHMYGRITVTGYEHAP